MINRGAVIEWAMELSPSLITLLCWISFASESNVKMILLSSCNCHPLPPTKYNQSLQNCDSNTIRNCMCSGMPMWC